MRRTRRVACAALTLSAALAAAGRAGATYSIVAVDTSTREVGGAGTSCLNGSNVYVIYGSVPGRGVVHAQATFSQAGRDRAVELLMDGTAPADIVASITAASFDRNAAVRQYAVADLEGRVAAYTGSGTQSFADDRQGMPSNFAYSVQGNILTGESVLTQAATAFEGGGCDLAERLVRALEAGAMGGEGDSRCTPDGIPSDSAFVQVDREGEPRGDYLELHVPSSGNDDPLVELRSDFDAWRASHPCPTPTGGAAGAAGAGAGAPGGASGAGGVAGASGRAGAGGAGTTSGTSGAGGSAGAAGAAGSAAGSGGAGAAAGSGGAGAAAGAGGESAGAAGGAPVIAGGASGMPGAPQPPSEDGGCGCRVAAGSTAARAGFWGVLAFGLVLRRRWNRSAHRC